MKIQLIDSRPGVAQAIILKEWMRIGLSICLLGLPVILGYFSIQIADARNAEFAKDSSAPALGDTFDFANQTPAIQNIPGNHPPAVSHHVHEPVAHNKSFGRKKLLPWQSVPAAERVSAADPALAKSTFGDSPLIPDAAHSADLFVSSKSFHEGLSFSAESHVVSAKAMARVAVDAQLSIRDWRPEVQHVHANALATVKNQAVALFAKYGDVLKKGHIVVLAAAVGYAADSYTGFALHKNGRIIDPASYIHSTIR